MTIKTKEQMEKKINEAVDSWRNLEVEGAWASKKQNYDYHKCNGQDGVDIGFTKKDFELLIQELKDKLKKELI